MKLTKPEYNENVTDVDALEKHRISQEGETERHVILQQETTKRTALEQKEQTRRHDNYLFRTAWMSVAAAIASIAFSVAGYDAWQDYTNLEKARIATPTCPKCPEVTCQPVAK